MVTLGPLTVNNNVTLPQAIFEDLLRAQKYSYGTFYVEIHFTIIEIDLLFNLF